MQTFKITNGILIVEIMPELGNAFMRHTKNIARHLRVCDQNEIRAASGREPYDVIMEAYSLPGKKWIVMRCDHNLNIPIAIYGVVIHPKEEGAGIPWMVATNDLKKIKSFVIRQSRACIDEAKKGFKYLYNFVDKRNEDSIKWLKACGFKIHDAIEYGAEQRLFHKFDMEVI
jgi:hypothetical protein